jgi:cellulose synthase/poly-beta-1,6-N-acetylglucosamine synthase-like glycosyltransferase
MIRTLFWAALAFVAYTYLIYPLLIIFLGRIRGRSVRLGGRAGDLPSVTMIIVAHNEKAAIEAKLANCRELDYPDALLEICVISDGSTDGTAELLRARDDIVFLDDPENRGKPHQLNKAMERSKSDILVFSDVRQMYDRAALMKLVDNFGDDEIGVVSGELELGTPDHPTGGNIGLYWTYEKVLREAESRVDSTVGVTGAIYAIRREFAAPIPRDTILDDVEIPLRAFRAGKRVIFEPGAKAFDTPSSDLKVEFRRKTRTLAGNYQLFVRHPWLLVPWKNRVFLQTVSHKLFRLIVPWALLLALATSSRLEGTGYALAFWGQAAAYALGVAALRSETLRRHAAVNFISVFITLNAAAVAGLYRFLTGTADVRWKSRG